MARKNTENKNQTDFMTWKRQENSLCACFARLKRKMDKKKAECIREMHVACPYCMMAVAAALMVHHFIFP